MFTYPKLSLRHQLKMLECYVWSLFWYGAETWTLKKTKMERITLLELWCYRRIVKISAKEEKINEEVLKKVNQQPKLMTLVMKQKMVYR